jgi:AAA family ATPase
MSEPRFFTVRPLSKQPRSDLKNSFRIYLSPSSLAVLKLRSGDLCAIRLGEASPKTTIAWPALESIQNSVVQTSRTLQDCYAIRLGDKVTINKIEESMGEADTIHLEECTDSDGLSTQGLLSSADRKHWEWGLQYPLLKCEVISIGLIFDIELKGHRRSFKVAEIRAQNSSGTQTIFRFTTNSIVKVGLNQTLMPKIVGIKVRPSNLGGISDQIARLNECLADFNSACQETAMPSFYERIQGVLIYGPKGTGKTALLEQIKGAGWRSSFVIGSSVVCQNVRDGEAQLRKLFHDATSFPA